MADNKNVNTAQKSLEMMNKMKEILSRKRSAPTEDAQDSETPKKRVKREQKLETGETSQETAKMEVDQITEDPPASAAASPATADDDDINLLFSDGSSESASASAGAGAGTESTDPVGASETVQDFYKIDLFMQDINASAILASFEEALQSGNIEEFGHQLENKAFPGILVMLCATHHINNDPFLLVKFLKKYVMGSKCDVIAFTEEYVLELQGYHPYLLFLALYNVMIIYNQANEVDEPADMVAEAVVTAVEAGIWDGRVFCVLSDLLDETLNRDTIKIGLVMITAVSKLCKARASKTLVATMIRRSGIDEVVGDMTVLDNLNDDFRQRVVQCDEALEDLLKQ